MRVAAEPPKVGEVMRTLWSKASFRHMSFAAALPAFVGYGVGGFNSAFSMRTHGLTVAEVGLWLALISAVGGITGTYLGGWLADRQTRKRDDMRWQLLVPGISTLLNAPIAVASYLLSDRLGVLVLMLPTTAIGAMYLGPTYATLQSMVAIRERAPAGRRRDRARGHRRRPALVADRDRVPDHLVGAALLAVDPHAARGRRDGGRHSRRYSRGCRQRRAALA